MCDVDRFSKASHIYSNVLFIMLTRKLENAASLISPSCFLFSSLVALFTYVSSTQNAQSNKVITFEFLVTLCITQSKYQVMILYVSSYIVFIVQ